MNMIMTEMSRSLEDTKKIAEVFLASLKIEREHACIVGLSGELGAGKTAFIQAVAGILGIKDTVTSPTFVIEKIYALPENTVKKYHLTHLIHVDAYRLESGKELEKLGWHDNASHSKNLILLEWPEKVADILPSDMIQLSFRHINETTREITIHQS